MSSNIHSTSARPTTAMYAASTWVAPASAHVRQVHAANAMWSKSLPVAAKAAAVAANRDKGAMGARGLWDPV